MTEEIKRIAIGEFLEKGFLQEVNRQFFHPLGLALEVIINDERNGITFGGVWDYSDDDEGMFFTENTIDEDKIKYVEKLRASKTATRLEVARGYGIYVNQNGIQEKNK